jgi:methyltransferase family protein
MFPMTTQDFTATEAYRSLERVGLVFVDGYHSIEQVRIDHEAFRGKLAENGVILHHDSRRAQLSDLYTCMCSPLTGRFVQTARSFRCRRFPRGCLPRASGARCSFRAGIERI